VAQPRHRRVPGGLAQLFHVFNGRTLDGVASGTRLFGNCYIWLAVAITIAAQLLTIYLPGLRRVLGTASPTPTEWLIVGRRRWPRPCSSRLGAGWAGIGHGRDGRRQEKLGE